MGTLAWKLWLGNFSLGTLAFDFRSHISDLRCQISDFRFQISDLRFQISDFRFQISDFRSHNLRFQISDFRSQFFSLGTLAWELWFGNFGLGISGSGNWAPEAGGTAAEIPGEPSGAVNGTGYLRY